MFLRRGCSCEYHGYHQQSSHAFYVWGGVESGGIKHLLMQNATRIIILAFIFFGGLIGGYYVQHITVRRPILVVPTPERTFISRAFSVEHRHPQHLPIAHDARIGIIPHHLVASRDLASYLTAFPHVRTLYLISPDHFSQGKTSITTLDQDMAWMNGVRTSTLLVDAERARALTSLVPRAQIAYQPFLTEHGIYNLLPFFFETNPKVHIVPIMIRTDTTFTDLDPLIRVIEQDMTHDPSVGVMVSIDFSHYQTVEVADFHDAFTQNAILRQDVSAIPRMEIDSHGSMYVALSLANALGYASTILRHTNSLVLTRNTRATESTSHVFVSFAPGSPATERTTTTFWHQLPRIETQENRLYTGFDEERVFQDATLLYFFGVIRSSTTTTVIPFPMNQKHTLLTFDQRSRMIHQDEKRLRAWIERVIRPGFYILVY